MRRAITLIMVLGIVIAGAAAEDIDVTYTVKHEDLEQIKVAFMTEAVSDVTGAKTMELVLMDFILYGMHILRKM